MVHRDANTHAQTRWKTPGYGFHAEAASLFPYLLFRARSPYRETSTESFPVHRCPGTGPQGKALRVTFSRNGLLDLGATVGDGAAEVGPKGTQLNGDLRPSSKVLRVNEDPRTMRNAAFHPGGSAINGSFVMHNGRVDIAPMDAHVEALRDRRGGRNLTARIPGQDIPSLHVKPLADCRLYTFIDTAYLAGRDPAELARQLCDGGSDLIQVRARGATVDDVRRLATAVLPVTRAAGVRLVINDHLGLAAELGAEVCHLGQEDFFDAGFTRVGQLMAEGDRPKIGLSTHAPDQAARAMAAGADYIAIGPVFATGTKPTAAPVTLGYVRWAAANVAVPWFAIGGIHLGNLDDVLAAGATRICVVSAILDAPDVAAACRGFRRKLG